MPSPSNPPLSKSLAESSAESAAGASVGAHASSGARREVIRLEALRKGYRMGGQEVMALNGVDQAFQAGEFWAILGASGSGKSTLLNLLGCLDRPTDGHYFLEGRDVSQLNDDALSEIRLRRIGFIFQSFNLIPQLTVLENIELPLFYLGWEVAESRARAAELADRVGLGSRLDHRPTQLSGGQQQRVACARALANDPAILLADEPTGNLDSATSSQIMGLLRDLNATGVTIIMVTHEDDVAAYASHHLTLRDGLVASVTQP